MTAGGRSRKSPPPSPLTIQVRCAPQIEAVTTTAPKTAAARVRRRDDRMSCVEVISNPERERRVGIARLRALSGKGPVGYRSQLTATAGVVSWMPVESTTTPCQVVAMPGGIVSNQLWM